MIKRVATFDLSTNVIGVIIADVNIETFEVINIGSMPILPHRADCDIAKLGYLKTKKKLSCKNKNKETKVLCYAKQGETHITKSEKKRRDAEVRNYRNNKILAYIGSELNFLITQLKPDIIIAEKNNIFNGILTTVLLAKVTGVLVGLAGANGTEYDEYNVNTSRGLYSSAELVKKLCESLSEEELKRIPDITKRAFRIEMERKYNIKFNSDDESDACVIFNYWLETIKQRGK